MFKRRLKPRGASEFITFLLPDATQEEGRFNSETAPSVLSVAIGNKVRLPHSCDGSGTCGTCRVFVETPELIGPRNELETDMAADRGFEEYERLACQIEACSGLVIRIPKLAPESE